MNFNLMANKGEYNLINAVINQQKKHAYDRATARIISLLYKGNCGSLRCFLQFFYHSQIFYKLSLTECYNETYSMALNEVLHLDSLAKSLLSLGENPVYYGYDGECHSQFLLSSLPYTHTPKQMLLDDISLKMQMIKTYENSLKKIKAEEIREKILRIKAEEELHLERLKILLKKYKDGEFNER